MIQTLRPIFVVTFAAVLLVLLTAAARAADALPVAVPPTDAAVHYVGRWDFGDATAPRADWSASEVALRFKGTGLNVRLKGTKDELQIIVDGSPTAILAFTKDETRYTLAKDLPDQEHTIQLVKRTEPMVSTEGIQFLGFELPKDGRALPWTAKPAHRLEVIGASITCGYGNEEVDQYHHFTAHTENAWLSFGPITARNFGAECHIVAWAGKKMSADNPMAEAYGRTFGNDATSKWDFSRWAADAVVINLGTNDFANRATVPNEKEWIEQYKKFITGTLRKNYPEAHIFISTSPIMAGEARTNLIRFLTTIQTDLAAAGDKKVHVLDFGQQDPKDGFGADWHPNVVTQKKMAEKLSQALETDLGWKR